MPSISRLLWAAFVLFLLAAECDLFESIRRVKRAELPLLFYGGSAITLIYGFGVPVQDLDPETVVVGYVFKCSYQLPTQPEHLEPHSNFATRKLHPQEQAVNITEFHARSNLSKYRWLLYKSMALFSEKLGYAGRVCVLKSICEAAAIPFHHYNGILGELAHLLMTPSSSSDDLSSNSDNEYYYAEAAGKSGRISCQDVFKECDRSLLDYFTKIFDL